MRSARVIFLLGTCCVAVGCREQPAAKAPSAAAGRAVAQRFAEAILRGEAGTAVPLLVDRDDPGLSRLVERAAAPWKTNHAVVRLVRRRPGGSWILGFAGTHVLGNGRFERVRGYAVVEVAASPKGVVGVKFFTLRNVEIQYRTHHDSLLLPSNR